MSDIEEFREKIFDDIRHIDEQENEYWEARELMKLLGYKDWKNFEKIIYKAMIACNNSFKSIFMHTLRYIHFAYVIMFIFVIFFTILG